MVDLSTKYLGLELRTPLMASASPLSQELSGVRALEDAGASAVVLSSLFEEQLRLETLELVHHLAASTESFPEALSFFPHSSEFHLGPDEYLNHILKAKAAVDVPLIASLNGSTVGGWKGRCLSQSSCEMSRAGRSSAVGRVHRAAGARHRLFDALSRLVPRRS